jgi:hypothetical protein
MTLNPITNLDTGASLARKLNDNFDYLSKNSGGTNVTKEDNGDIKIPIDGEDNYIPSLSSINIEANSFEDIRVKGDKSIVTNSRPNNYPITNDNSPVICITFDRQRKELISSHGRGNGFPAGGFKEIFDTLGVKFNISIVDNDHGGDYLTIEELLQLQSEGHELMSHIRADDTSPGTPDTYNDFQAEQAIVAKKSLDIGKGFKVYNANMFRGRSTTAYKSQLRKYYRGIFGGGSDTNDAFDRGMPINQYGLTRLDMDNGNYNSWIAQADKAIAVKTMFQFFGHAYTDDWYTVKKDDNGVADEAGDYTWQKIIRFIQYIQAKAGYGTPGGVKILTCNQALDIHGNIIDIGVGIIDDTLNDFFRVSYTGKVDSAKLRRIYTTPTLTKLNASVDDVIGQADRCTQIGADAGRSNTQQFQTAIGQDAGRANTGTFQIAVGTSAGRTNSGAQQVAVGYEAGMNNTGGEHTGLGYLAGKGNTGRYSLHVGNNAGFGNTGRENTSIGASSGFNNIGGRSTFLGYRSGLSNTGASVIALGFQAGESNTESNVFILEHRFVSVNPLIKGYFDTGAVILGAPITPVADALMGNSRVSMSLDEAGNKLKFKVKYSNGTIKNGEVNLV